MKTISICALLIFVLVNECKSQESIYKHKSTSKFKLDRTIFNKYQLLKQNKSAQFISNRLLVTFIELDKYYQVTKQQPKSNFKKFWVYNKHGNLTASGAIFGEFEVGVISSYNNDGKILSQTNEDLDYKFSVANLISKIRKVYKIDLLNANPDISIDRYSDESTGTPTYYILIKQASFQFRDIRINGSTGELISDEVIYAEE